MKKALIIIVVALLTAGICDSAKGAVYNVMNLDANGTGSFEDCLAQSESDGETSRIVFDVGGTIYPGQKYTISAGNLTICATNAPSPGITFDFAGGTMGFFVDSADNRFCNITMTNTKTNTDGISLFAADNVVERCTFTYCRDEGVGVSGAGARGNVVAYSRFEYCGSQPPNPLTDGRAILVTSNSSAVIVGNYAIYCCRGVQANYSGGFIDFRNNLIEGSLKDYNLGLNGADGNIIDNILRYHIGTWGRGLKLLAGEPPTCEYYRSGNQIYGNTFQDEYIEEACVQVFEIITHADTPFPDWLVGAETPAQASDVGMGTGSCECMPEVSGGVTIEYPGFAQGTASMSYQVREPGLPPSAPLYAGDLTVTISPGNPATGAFTIPNVPDGTFDVVLKHDNHIAGMEQEVIVSGSDLTGLDVTLWAGDGDGNDNSDQVEPGDNDVDFYDYYALYYQYLGSIPVTEGEGSDYDADSDIDFYDYYGLYYGYLNSSDPGNWY